MKIDKPYIFITGAPRSGTSMVTKIIDAHPQTAIFMEQIFGLRRRHGEKPSFWNDNTALFAEVEATYAKLNAPLVGNKVCTPDVWHLDEMMQMGAFFRSVKIIFIVRDPADVLASRAKREAKDHFSDESRRYLCLDWRSQYHTWLSSWRQSIDIYWALKERFGEAVHLLYYDDFVQDVPASMETLFSFLELDITDEVMNWHLQPSHDRFGNLVMDLKYKNEPITPKHSVQALPEGIVKRLEELAHYRLWQQRRL